MFVLDQLNLWLLFLLSSHLSHLVWKFLTVSSMYGVLYCLTYQYHWLETELEFFHSVLYNIKFTLIACEIFQFLCKGFYEIFSLFCEKDKRKVIVFQSSSIHCDIVGRPFSVWKLLLILLRNFLGNPAVTYMAYILWKTV